MALCEQIFVRVFDKGPALDCLGVKNIAKGCLDQSLEGLARSCVRTHGNVHDVYPVTTTGGNVVNSLSREKF